MYVCVDAHTRICVYVCTLIHGRTNQARRCQLYTVKSTPHSPYHHPRLSVFTPSLAYLTYFQRRLLRKALAVVLVRRRALALAARCRASVADATAPIKHVSVIHFLIEESAGEEFGSNAAV